MGKKAEAKDRQAKMEEMRRRQQAEDRRRLLLVMGAAVLAVVVLVGVVVVVVRNELSNRPPSDLAAYGVPAADADCDDVELDPAEGVNDHQPVGTAIEYETVPPSAGPHWPSPEFPANAFYTDDDRPAMENLVHNLEHGYTIVWYGDDLPQEQVDALSDLADVARDDERTGGKFIVAAWDEERGALPEGKPLAMSHWGVDNGYRQYCGQLSGEVVDDFVEAYPYTDSPEPNAQ
ncbi:DUF3105 domain-containing protein [Thalassiella azotivora]